MASPGLNLRGVISVALNVCACCILIFMIVYLYTNLINGKGYVGITSISLAHRMGQHPTGKTYFSNALRKYGKDAFNVEIIDYATTKEELSEKERYWIAKLGTMAPAGYNLTTGGEGMYQLTAESCRKISLSKIGKPRPDVKPEDLTGQKFGRLTALSIASLKPPKWLCVCECGKEHIVDAAAMKKGHIRSCGCLRSEVTHARKFKYGSKHNTLYNTWLTLRRKGDKTCERWRNSFEDYAADMGKRPEGKIICRRDKDRGYSPENCFWGTKYEHAKTSSSTLMLEADGKVQNLNEWRRELHIRGARITEAIRNGVDFQDFVEDIHAKRAI